jgi:hypothetical protein
MVSIVEHLFGGEESGAATTFGSVVPGLGHGNAERTRVMAQRTLRLTLLSILIMMLSYTHLSADETQARPLVASADKPTPVTVRVAAVQAKRRLVDWHVQQPAEVLAAVDESLAALEKIVHSAGERKCDVLAFPEDTLGLLNWYGMNERIAGQVLPEAVTRMLDRLRTEYRGSWIDRVAAERLRTLRHPKNKDTP